LQLSFLKYHPSEYEIRWLADILKNQEAVCQLQNQNYQKYVDAYLASQEMLTPQSPPPAPPRDRCSHPSRVSAGVPKKLPMETFSVFEYTWKCAAQPSQVEPNVFVAIEPLAGILRHPKVCTNEAAFVVRKDYMVLDQWAVFNVGVQTTNKERKFFYFDLGASTWTTGAGGASQGWFHSVYKDVCVSFDHYYAWEAKVTDPALIFNEIPSEVKPHYHWFNIPASTTIGHGDNPLTYVLSQTTPEDFVVFKIDIDNWQVEEAFINQILSSPALLLRIDEMFWEHHVNFQPMVKYWGKTIHTEFKMNDSLHLFDKLRSKGVRVHSWV
jgi:hypothetical protein